MKVYNITQNKGNMTGPYNVNPFNSLQS